MLESDLLSENVASRTSEPHWIVRGGIVTPTQLVHGTMEHLRIPGLFGFSVQHQPGCTIDELAASGRFPHAHISFTMVEALIAAAKEVGYNVAIVRSPGIGFHHTVQVPYPMPEVLAEALSAVFEQMPNPQRR